MGRQWRFKQTAKTPGRKKTGLVFRCNEAACVFVGGGGGRVGRKDRLDKDLSERRDFLPLCKIF